MLQTVFAERQLALNCSKISQVFAIPATPSAIGSSLPNTVSLLLK